MVKVNWYEEYIEEPIRKLVFLLRNAGFNTTCSCGHEMYIEMEQYVDDAVTRLYNLLYENGYHHFIITTSWERRRSFGWDKRTMRLELLENKDGEIDDT